jgi:hypothetical protein
LNGNNIYKNLLSYVGVVIREKSEGKRQKAALKDSLRSRQKARGKRQKLKGISKAT